MSSPHETPRMFREAEYKGASQLKAEAYSRYAKDETTLDEATREVQAIGLPADHRRIVYGLLVGLLFGGVVLRALAYCFPFGGG